MKTNMTKATMMKQRIFTTVALAFLQLGAPSVVVAFVNKPLYSSNQHHRSSFGGLSSSSTFVQLQRSPGKQSRSPTALQYLDGLPSVEQVSVDSFTDQIYYASVIVRELSLSSSKSSSPSPSSPSSVIEYNDFEDTPIITTNSNNNNNNDDDEKKEEMIEHLLHAQLSHQDGIRGFLSVYLTGQEGQHNPADDDKLPPQLLSALKMSDLQTVAPMLCMNVVRPTAMASAHTDPIFAANSAKIAERGAKLLSNFKGSINVIDHCKAIVAACAVPPKDQRKVYDRNYFFADEESSSKPQPQGEDKLVQFWKDIFEQDGYTTEQKASIANMFSTLGVL
eukprot:CAMPEP_0195291040 /NCGR_PEP_ID=MMETSP0707-20130614/7041_1 /TAXON_ID=33640 /ORGANISM="Asterionellopsis glacialis, Strain CCMP134" /LENGTH=334 /DNA_ID=CAMNT_0040351275 /DNA_START=40 /DNA_END=1044 /DNA_ORIENTATION=+